MKKRYIAAICAGTAVVLVGAVFGISQLVKGNAAPVEVQPVSQLNVPWYGQTAPTSGTITSNATQSVRLQENGIVEQVFVKEGDQVKIGDNLFAYDKTLLEIEFDGVKLDAQAIELQIGQTKKDIQDLKDGKSISENSYVPEQFGDYGGGEGEDEEPNDDDEADAGNRAGLVNAKVVMTANNPEAGSTGSATPPAESETPPAETETPLAETETPPAETEPQTEPISESQEQTEQSPLAEIKAYKRLRFNSKPYEGEGTKEEPYVFFCQDGVTIDASFMNKLLGYNEAGTSRRKGGMKEDGKGSYATLIIREGDAITGGLVKSININGTVKADKAYEPGVTWTFTSEGITKNVPEVDEPETDDIIDEDDLFDGDIDDGNEMTAEERQQTIKDKEAELADLELSLRDANIKVQKAEKKMNEAIVKATINGVVKAIGDPELGEIDDEAFATVTSNEGLYVRGTISELKLGQVKVGTVMTGTSYESGSSFSAKITEISEFPSTGQNDYNYDENSNSSQYPFLAYIEESDGLNNNEMVSLVMQGEEAATTGIFIEKPYIRSENGQSYVYKADENNRLIKQYIKTGQDMESYATEILEGLTLEDRIAFPYGKDVKEGARVINKGEDEADGSEDGEAINPDIEPAEGEDIEGAEFSDEDIQEMDPSDAIGGLDIEPDMEIATEAAAE